MVYDAKDGYVVLFGGENFTDTGLSIVNEELWLYSNSVWSEILPADITRWPTARVGASMAYDAADGYVVMFGGSSPYLGLLNDTWIYHARAVLQVTPSVSPTQRWHASMTYDAADNYVLLFGGQDASGSYLNDTWRFSGYYWTPVTTAQAPPPRAGGAMAFDASDRFVVLYSGSAAGSPINDTWRYVADQWYNLTSKLSRQPIAQFGDPLVYDPSYSGVLLVETAPGTAGAPTFLFSGSSWRPISMASTGPPGYANRAGTYDPEDQYLLLFGGAPVDDTTKAVNATWGIGITPVVVALVPTPVELDLHQTVSLSVRIAPPDPVASVSFQGLPSGCASANVTVLQCTPNATGVNEINVTDTPIFGRAWTSGNLTLLVDAWPTVGGVTIVPGTTTKGQPISITATGVTGKGPLSYAFLGTPVGCPSVNSTHLACSPASWGNFTVTVRVTDPRQGFGQTWATLHVNDFLTVGPLKVSPWNFVDLGEPIRFYSAPSGGTAPITYTFGGLPPGCASADAPNLTCAPSSLGRFQVTINATDARGANSSAGIGLVVSPRMVLGAVRASPSVLDTGSPVTFTTDLNGGSGPYRVDWSGLPPGCAAGGGLNLTCTPNSSGTFHVRLTITDAATLSTNSSTTLTVYPAPQIVSVVYPGAGWDIERGFAIAVAASGGAGNLTYRFIVSGAPSVCTRGVAANRTVCDVSQPGTFGFQATVLDTLGGIGSFTGTVPVHALPAITGWQATPSELSVGQTFTLPFVVSGGTSPLTSTLSGFPDGCVLDASAFEYTCRASNAGTIDVGLSVTDATGAGDNATTQVVVSTPTPPLFGPLGTVGAAALVAGGAVVLAAAAWLGLHRRALGRPPPGS
jgi:hypothetical protein